MALRDEYFLAKKIGASVRTIQGWRRMRKGPRFRKIGHLVRYSDEDIRAWLDSRDSGGEQPKADLMVAKR
jgi:predicted DNA-binding transcriptional regulator AlpA